MEYLAFGMMALLVIFGAFLQSLIGLGYVLLVAPFLVLYDPNFVSVGIAGFFSGIMGTLAGLGGPPMAILYQNEKGSVIRGTLSGFSILGTVLSLLFLEIAGKFTLNDLKLFSYMVPGIIAGFYLSKYAISFVDKGYIRKAMLGVSFLAAIVVIIKALKL